MRTRSLVVSLILLAQLGACATSRVVSAPSASALTRLEREQRASPASARVNRALGIAYHQLGRYPEARTSLETAARLDPRDGTTALYLGMTAEAQDDLPAAKRAYASYLEFGRTTRVRGQLQARLAALARKELTLEARAAVKQESTLGTQAGSPRTVAVLPLRFSGADSSLRPLERGFAELLTTDLARSSQLTVVERDRLQALLDELALQGSGATSAASNVRAGRLLRAGRLVQGSLLQLPNSQLRVDAAVVDVPTSQVKGTAQGADQLDQLFTLEKRIVLDLFRQLGVTLTVAERNAIEQRPTRSLAAFVAYSRGLVAEDDGRFDDAGRFYDDAVRLDPGFGAAQQRSARAQQASAGAAVTPATIHTSLQGTPEGAVVAAASGGSASPGTGALGGTLKVASDGVNGSTAQGATAGATVATSLPAAPIVDALSAATGTDKPATTGVITIILPRPTLP
jgi:tetratricopeptide (TPR) repeat protein